MAKENESSVFGGFELLADALGASVGESKIPNDDINVVDVDPEELANLDTEDDNTALDDVGDDGDDDSGDDAQDAEDIALGKKPAKDTSTNDAEDLSEFEPDVAAFFQQRLADELGWEFEEDEKFESVSDVVDYMSKVVEEASKPKYASDEVAAYDEFVRNGGNLRDFFGQTVDGTLDLTSLDLENERDQKAVVRELLKEQGLKDAVIQKRLSRYEDTGILADEAEEALSQLSEIKEEKKVKLLEQQKLVKRQAEEQQREFFSSVDKTVKEMKNIRGIPVNDAEKKEILDYIFKPTSDGRTQYQKEYMSNVKNLIESAYFTKKGDVLIDRAKKKAASDTALDLKKKISAKKGNRLSGNDNRSSGSYSVGFGNLGSMLLKKV